MIEMKESDKRIGYISDYISAYEEKIRLLNSKGLFDNAKLFELFAMEACKIIFDEDFTNLNLNTFTYPHVDLISKSKKMYVQVSTVRDVPAKIRKTLEGIRDSKNPELKSVEIIKFFMLNNDSVTKVKDFVGDKQIGDIPFVKEKDLITTGTLLDRAMTDLDFQIEFFELVRKDIESINNNATKLNEAIERCKAVELRYINCHINNEYEIERTSLVNKVKSCKSKHITVLGGPGTGKSVICRKVVESYEAIIFSRAERLLESSTVNDIWGFNIRETFEMLGESQLVIFIDALEFIADSQQRIAILHELYDISSKYPNIKIISSCRTSDFTSFIRINDIFKMTTFEVPELTEKEITQISEHYPIISKMTSIPKYKELLKNPLYINIIVSNINNIDEIESENQLREYIWNNVICLKNKANILGLQHNEIMQVVESIVFDRATNFLLGSSETLYNSKIINALISEDILIRSGKKVRLKYDIFEDITFEQYFDSMFDKCQGDYGSFYNSISDIGRCVYRRYQIWISNKLLAKENREKFIAEILFSDKTPDEWRKQTQIGLVKSRFSKSFFEEYSEELISKEVINDYIKITNLYGFEIDNESFKKYINMIELRPIGQGRLSLIKIIFQNRLYETDKVEQPLVQKLCTDFSKILIRDKYTETCACRILEHYIDDYFKILNENRVYGLDKEINVLLQPVYNMVESSKDWIINFWDNLKPLLLDENKEALVSKIVDNTLGATHVRLSLVLPEKLCELADFYWTYTTDQTNQGRFFYQRDRIFSHILWGLNEHAERYDHRNYNNNPEFSSFFFALLKTNYWYALEWLINFLNKLSLEFALKNDIKTPNYDIYFVERKTHHRYYGDASMWTVGSKENNLPMIINDFIYLLKNEIIYRIKNDFGIENDPTSFATKTRDIIYEKSNNIILLSVVSDIGKEFAETLSGYSIDLISSFDIIYNDLSKITLFIKNPTRELLEKQILLTVGLSDLPDRYKKNNCGNIAMDIRNYARYCQFIDNHDIRDKCYMILDYLYSVTPNDAEHGSDYLQIQNMDARILKYKHFGNGLLEITPEITGEAKKIAESSTIDMAPQSAFNKALYDLNELASKQRISTEEVIPVIEIFLKNQGDDVFSTMYEKDVIDLIAYVLNAEGLSKQFRSKYSLFWVEGIERYFRNGSFVFEHHLVKILFQQVEKDIDEEVRKRIERFIIDCILSNGNHGVIYKISTFAKQYLRNSKKIAQAVFNTIFKLAQDEMNHQVYNWNYLKSIDNESIDDFKPNFTRKLRGVDYKIREKNEAGYLSHKNSIIQNFLYEKADIDLTNFDIDDFDISIICNAFNFGVSLETPTIDKIARLIVETMIRIWDELKNTHSTHEIIDLYSKFEFIDFLSSELTRSYTSAQKVLELLFDNISFEIFTKETYDFYETILGKLLVAFFDSHSDAKERELYKNILNLLEGKVVKIENGEARKELLKTVILSPSSNYLSSDWTKCKAGYTYIDKMFLNQKISLYGYLHLEESLRVIHKLHYDKLLPEIIISLNETFIKAINYYRNDSTYVSKFIYDKKQLILQILYKAYVDFSDQIKQDKQMTSSFESILEVIVGFGHEEFAVILDEFRVH